jgi:CheY-like chemotaxis protein
MELHPEPYLMASFNDYIDSVFKPLYEEKNQTFEVELHPVRSVVPIIDVLRFNQIIFNLLSNAVKYTPEGGTIKLNVWNELVEGHREQIIVKVIDNGVGMSEEFQKVLFDPFSQETHSDETSEGNGTGLGLSIVKKLVDLMGGRIEVQSTLGKGSTFTVAIDFDYIDADQATWGQHEAAGPVDVDALAGKHVLVCEDHPLNQEIALHLLKGDGLNVTLAEDGKKGVQLFEVSPPKYYDAVLMDVRMPVMDGLQATRAIRALDRADAASVPIIAMTADAYADDVRKCIDAGMNAHVPKPIDPEVLTATLAKWCMRS